MKDMNEIDRIDNKIESLHKHNFSLLIGFTCLFALPIAVGSAIIVALTKSIWAFGIGAFLIPFASFMANASYKMWMDNKINKLKAKREKLLLEYADVKIVDKIELEHQSAININQTNDKTSIQQMTEERTIKDTKTKSVVIKDSEDTNEDTNTMVQ